MTVTRRFTLPETHDAFLRWSSLTGYDWDSPEWGEVLAVLESCDLMRADRNPQHGLFDPPDMPWGDAPEVRRLRTVIVASAWLHCAGWGHDLATSAQIVAAVLDRFYADSDTAPLDPLIEHLAADLPARVYGLAETPGAALAGVLAADGLVLLVRRHAQDKPGLMQVVLEEAEANDAFAEAVFARLADDPEWRLELLRLSDGRCLLYTDT